MARLASARTASSKSLILSCRYWGLLLGLGKALQTRCVTVRVSSSCPRAVTLTESFAGRRAPSRCVLVLSAWMGVTKETPGERKCCHRGCKSLFSEERPSLKTLLICVRACCVQTCSEGVAPLFYKRGRGRTLLFQLIQRNAPLISNVTAIVLLPV